MDLLKVTRFPYQKRLHNKEHLHLATEVLEDFIAGTFSKLCVIHRKSRNDGNLELKSEPIILFFFKVVLKEPVVNSDS